MAKYNVKATKSPVPVKVAKPAVGVLGTKKSGKTAVTYEGHSGFARTDKSALFFLAAGSLGGEDKFYESGKESTKRLVDLVRKVAVKDAAWMTQFINWLRSEGNIRTAAVVAAVEAADAMVKAGLPGGRQIVASAFQRADEPGEAMAYWLATRPGQIMSKPIKRGIADAAERLYNEYSFMKYDSDRNAVRFGDVIEMTRPDPGGAGTWKNDLFRYAIEKRHGRANGIPESLTMIRRRALLQSEGATEDWLNPEILREAGVTWENALSFAGSKVDKGKVWKAMLPQLGYMALIRNLRNLDQNGLTDKDVAPAIARIQDPEQVAKSRQLPYRFYSAYKEAPSLRWGHALEVALSLSLKNIPALTGRTLILIDTSASMSWTMSNNSKRRLDEVAGLFGLALGLKGDADVWAWASSAYQFEMSGTSVLRNLEKFMRENGRVGSGTDLDQAIRKAYVPGKYARMVVISDMQSQQVGLGRIPIDIPCYFFNLAGYVAAIAETKGMIYELGGLSDSTFRMIPMLEAGVNGRWPWDQDQD